MAGGPLTLNGVNSTSLPLLFSHSGALNLSFPTLPGYSYQVEYTTNLNGAPWLPLGSLISGNGSSQTVSDTPGSSNRFYRLQIQ